jgi:hypothetical protein
VKGPPRVSMSPESVAINPIKPDADGVIIDDQVNVSTIEAADYVKKVLSP